jgi:protein SCO1/2
MSTSRTALYLIPLLLIAAAAGYMVSRLLARDEAPRPPQVETGTVLPRARALPAFALTDHTGTPFDNARLAGQPSLVFFGFTHCPDVCPTTLALMAQLLRDERLANLRPVFVTVDPDRDDQTTMAQYVTTFDPRIVGVRGEEAALEPLLRGLGVAHAIVPLPGGGYTVDHSAALLYLNDRGHWSAAFTPPFDLPKLRQDLATLMASGY